MADQNPDIGVRLSALGIFTNELNLTAQTFREQMSPVARKSMTPGNPGRMEEGKALLQTEAGSAGMLAEYMTRTADGLGGYSGAAGQITKRHTAHGAVTAQVMEQIMKPYDAPTRKDPMFDPANVIDNQRQNEPPVNPPPPGAGGH